MKYRLSIEVGLIEGETLERAKKKAYQQLMDYAGSNDGSELLANAVAILDPVTDEEALKVKQSRFG